MATYTTNYQLHQWEPEDNFLRTDFNQDFAKIDAAIKTVDTKLTNGLAQAAQNLTAGLAQRPYVVGTLAGGLQTTTTIRVGFKPSFGFLIGSKFMAIIIEDQMQYRFDSVNCGSFPVTRTSTGLSFTYVPSNMISDTTTLYYAFFKV